MRKQTPGPREMEEAIEDTKMGTGRQGQWSDIRMTKGE